MKDYVFYIALAPGNMGGRWEHERKVITLADDEAAREEIRKINANWASVLFCFPADCEITLQTDNQLAVDPNKPTVIKVLKDGIARMDYDTPCLSFGNVSFMNAPKVLNIQGDLKTGVPIKSGTLFTVSHEYAKWLTNNEHEVIELLDEATK